MNYNLAFCLELLRIERQAAKSYNVEIPSCLVAIRQGHRQWFVQGKNDDGRYVAGDNAFHARANYIRKLIREQHPQLDDAQ